MADRPGRGPVSVRSDGGLAAGLRLGSAVSMPPGWDGALVPVSPDGGASGSAGGGGRMPESAGLGRVPGRPGASGRVPVTPGEPGSSASKVTPVTLTDSVSVTTGMGCVSAKRARSAAVVPARGSALPALVASDTRPAPLAPSSPSVLFAASSLRGYVLGSSASGLALPSSVAGGDGTRQKYRPRPVPCTSSHGAYT